MSQQTYLWLLYHYSSIFYHYYCIFSCPQFKTLTFSFRFHHSFSSTSPVLPRCFHCKKRGNKSRLCSQSAFRLSHKAVERGKKREKLLYWDIWSHIKILIHEWDKVLASPSPVIAVFLKMKNDHKSLSRIHQELFCKCGSLLKPSVENNDPGCWRAATPSAVCCLLLYQLHSAARDNKPFTEVLKDLFYSFFLVKKIIATR